MRVIVDTSVWVSAFLTPHGTPGKLLHEVEQKRLILVYDITIEAEYRDVLSRPRFNIAPVLVAEFLARLREDGQRIAPPPVAPLRLPDPDDAPFIAAALAATCPIITGNRRHFPPECGVEVLSPAQCLSRLFTE
ncbi:MAG: putative toxin-antitoxin system toxin component, PIN family [Pseudomonadota bacterium]|nr:MAG: putative toxin-antitoxin system toxin component, PIN family [Pseudomonadota bacterium]